MYRLFVGIDLPQNVKGHISKIYGGLPGARWTEPLQLHLTLRFIGDVDGVVYEDVQEALSEIQAQTFKIELKSIGFFPPKRNPNILWIGVEKNDDLNHFQGKVERQLVSHAQLKPADRKYHPHVTIARLKKTPPHKVGSFLEWYGLFKSETFQVNEFQLYISTLSPQGSIYQISHRYKLSQVDFV